MNLEKQFAKQLAPELRKETADKIREVRNRPGSYEELKKSGAKELPADYEGWDKAQECFAQLKKDIIGKIFKTEKYREAEASLNSIFKVKNQHDIENIQAVYERRLREIMKDCPLTPEEKDKYLTTAALEEMPLEDYLTLLKRLSGEAFYHVTRYGVRENTFMYHNGGEGSFINTLIPLLKDGHINSFASSLMKDPKVVSESLDSEKIREWLRQGKESERIIKDLVANHYIGDHFLDRESTHFSYGEDKHHMYGCENDYKFYFYYPVEYIVHNDFFHKTRESDLVIGRSMLNLNTSISQQYNDFEVFNFGEGVPTGAGLLCITGNIPVDPLTGSQYLLKDGCPEKDENGNFKKPEKTISSQEYWEKYFGEHPEIKPNKLIFGNFSTYDMKGNEELEKEAAGKNIFKQSEEKMTEFKEYERQVKAEITRICEEKVRELKAEVEAE